MMPSLVLGSQSPRRKNLLKMVGYTFSVKPADIEEIIPEELTPEEAVLHLSMRKSEAISIAEDEILLTSDTVVAFEGHILGKPNNNAEAYRFLDLLSGHTHQVYTGVTIKSSHEEYSFASCTNVTFHSLTQQEKERYIETGEHRDKAGGYGIQGKGSLLVDKIEGDYYSVVGLPISKVVRELERFGVILA